jgi:hypothetical protein
LIILLAKLRSAALVGIEGEMVGDGLEFPLRSTGLEFAGWIGDTMIFDKVLLGVAEILVNIRRWPDSAILFDANHANPTARSLILDVEAVFPDPALGIFVAL